MYQRGTSSLSDTTSSGKIHRFIEVHEKKVVQFSAKYVNMQWIDFYLLE